jgi:excisionase family DNA binding protein
MAERLERVAWLAEVLNCSSSTAYYLIQAGRVPGVVRLGPSAIRLDPDAVLEWIASGGYAADELAEAVR